MLYQLKSESVQYTESVLNINPLGGFSPICVHCPESIALESRKKHTENLEG